MRLRDLPHWICWKYEERGGKPTKVPRNPLTRELASSTDPATWATYEKARERFKAGGYEGIGFVFTADDPFCGIDLDKCVQDGEIAPWAQEIVDELDSYTELSPSGTGLHIIVRAELPSGGNRKGSIEMYDRGRFFTITSRKVGRAGVEERQEQVNALHARLFPQRAEPEKPPVADRGDHAFTDEEIIRRASEAKNGPLFTQLWAGDAAGYESASEADQALVNLLAFWAGPDAARIESLFAQSGLNRDKWRKRADYRRRTIERALSDMHEYYTPRTMESGNSKNGKTTRARARGAARDDVSESGAPPPTHYAPLPDTPPFPVDVLPKACQRLVEEGTAALGCAPDLLVLPVLAALSVGIGGARIIKIKRDWSEPAALFLAAVAAPGAKKTPASKTATAPVWKKQAEHRREYRGKMEEHDLNMREWEADVKRARKDQDTAPPSPPEPMLQRTIAEDTTVEALVQILEENPRGILVDKDELTGWVRGLDQYKAGGKGSDRQHWLSFWSNRSVVVDRKSKGEPVMVERPWVSLFGGIQPSMLNELGAAQEDGLLDRFLFAYPNVRRIPFSQAEISHQAQENYAELCESLFDLTMGVDKFGDDQPRALELDFETRRTFGEYADSLSGEAHEPGFPTRLQGVWSKLEAYLARLTLILAVSRCTELGLPERIEESDIDGAWQMVRYFAAHARRVYSEISAAKPEDLLAAELRDFLKEEEQGGEWIGEPTELYEELEGRDADGLPENAEWLSKMAVRIAERSETLKVERKRKRIEGKVKRVLRLELLRNTVHTVHTVHAEEAAVNTVNTVNSKNTAEQTKSLRVEERCKHEIVGGKGCALCDPGHPFQKEKGATEWE